eukprot:15431213-Alexandrium_andersonii.AAC.1
MRPCSRTGPKTADPASSSLKSPTHSMGMPLRGAISSRAALCKAALFSAACRSCEALVQA